MQMAQVSPPQSALDLHPTGLQTFSGFTPFVSIRLEKFAQKQASPEQRQAPTVPLLPHTAATHGQTRGRQASNPTLDASRVPDYSSHTQGGADRSSDSVIGV